MQVRAVQDAARRERRVRAQQRAENALKQEESLQRSLAKSRDAEKERLQRTIDWGLRRQLPPWAVDGDIVQARAFLGAVRDLCPRLIDERYIAGVYYLGLLPHVRQLPEWEPRGKGLDSIFRSLAQHLLGKFPVGAVLWNGLLDDNAPTFALAVQHVAGGGSFSKFVKEGGLPTPLTAKQCHEVLTTSSEYTLFDAVRRVLVKTNGGDFRLFQALKTTPWGRQFMNRAQEEFWLTVIAWFAKNPMLDPTQVQPLCDYIDYRQRQDPEFSMKGRSVLAMIRGMQEWHGELATRKKVVGAEYKPSGFREAEYRIEYRDHGETKVNVWRVIEILSGKDLADEGRRMHHCVSSYGYRIECGQVSIWSLTKQDGSGNWAQLTIEVVNQSRRIVQYRGICNRVASTEEFRVLSKWAAENGLAVSSVNGW